MPGKTKKAKKTAKRAPRGTKSQDGIRLVLSKKQVDELAKAGRGAPPEQFDGRSLHAFRRRGLVTGAKVVKRTKLGDRVLKAATGR